jgi:hypothetical protein
MTSGDRPVTAFDAARRSMVGERPERLLITSEADAQKGGRFTARLESTGEDVVANTKQPLVDGARELLARGFDPATLLTMRHEGKAYDSFQPLPIGKWAGWTYEERDRDGLRCVRWIPRALHAGGQKSGFEPSVVPNPHPEANSLPRAAVVDAGMPPRFGADQPS